MDEELQSQYEQCENRAWHTWKKETTPKTLIRKLRGEMCIVGLPVNCFEARTLKFYMLALSDIHVIL